jgi:hypothetical protein
VKGGERIQVTCHVDKSAGPPGPGRATRAAEAAGVQGVARGWGFDQSALE